MQLMLENPYTKKLFEQIRNRATELKLLTLSELAALEPGHCIIVDEEDRDAYEAFHYLASELIILTEKKENAPSEKSQGSIRFVKKYQSTKNILTLISQAAFPITFLGFSHKKAENTSVIERIVKKHEIDMVISLNFSPNSNFSLFDSLVRLDHEVISQANLDVISNIEDYLNPPTFDIIQLLKRLKERKRLLIVSAPLKGALDSEIMTLSDTILLVDNDPAQRLEPHLKHRLRDKKFEVVTYDELS